MKRFKNILLITSQNDVKSPDIKRAVSLAKSNAATLTIADIVPGLPLMDRQVTPTPGIASVLSALAEKRLNELKLMAKELSDKMDITPLVLQGTPYLEIIRVVMQQGCDLVIKISEPEKSFAAKILGSTDFRLLRKCPCPVWLLKPDALFSFHSILAAVALETFDEDEDIDGLNKQILEMATSLALEESSELHIVHAWKAFGKDLLKLPMAGYIEVEVQEWMMSQRHDIEERFNHVTALLKKNLKDNNMEKAVDNYYNFLGEQRDPLVEKLFKQNLDNFLYDLDKKKEYQEIFKAWVKLKRRKSYLSPENLLRFGQVLQQLQLDDNAIEIYSHILKYKMYSEHWPAARKQLIRIYFQLGHHRECLQKEKSEFNYYRLFSYLHLEKDEEAEKFSGAGAGNFDQITDIFQYRIALLKAQHLVKKNKPDEALDIYRQMIAFNQVPREDEGRLMIAIANLYYELRDPESSLSYYRLAEKTNTNMEWVLFRMVTILKQMGKKSGAVKEMEKLKEINPDSFWVRQLEKNVR